MNTYQIQCVINSDIEMKQSIVGVYPSDELCRIRLKTGTGVIANTDIKQLPGRHWVAFYYNKNNILEVFDSFGQSENELTVFFKGFMYHYSNILANDKRLQSDDTDVCGQYCLFYLMCRVRGFSMCQITDLFSENFQLNDQFVSDFIDRRFHCCVDNVCYDASQSCIKLK